MDDHFFIEILVVLGVHLLVFKKLKATLREKNKNSSLFLSNNLKVMEATLDIRKKPLDKKPFDKSHQRSPENFRNFQ